MPYKVLAHNKQPEKGSCLIVTGPRFCSHAFPLINQKKEKKRKC